MTLPIFLVKRKINNLSTNTLKFKIEYTQNLINYSINLQKVVIVGCSCIFPIGACKFNKLNQP